MTFSGMQGGLNLPLYPNSELGLRIKQDLTEHLSAKFGLLNAMADNPTAPWNTDVQFNSKYGAMAIGELDYTPMARTKIIAGYWTFENPAQVAGFISEWWPASNRNPGRLEAEFALPVSFDRRVARTELVAKVEWQEEGFGSFELRRRSRGLGMASPPPSIV